MKNYAVAAVLSLWIALAALTSLVVREIGWARLKKYSLTLIVLGVAVLAVPGAGLVKVTQPYRSRILAYVLRRHSPTVDLGNGCSVFPVNNIWNMIVRDLPVDANSRTYIATMGPELPVHADFGVVGGIPYSVIDGSQAVTNVVFPDGGGESDRGPYRIPDDVPVEPGSDSHAIVLDRGNCKLYELYAAVRSGPGQWQAGSGAIFDLRSNALRPEGWTSADAAGLPIFAGLIRYEEVKAGAIHHALRFTTPHTRRAFVWPGRHLASSSNDASLPPMGQRFRLRTSVDISGFTRSAQVILTALKEYGMMLSDNGGPWYLTGAPDSGWDAQTIADLKKVSGADFEAVDVSSLMVDRNSAEARQ
jgi:hypothetical protein